MSSVLPRRPLHTLADGVVQNKSGGTCWLANGEQLLARGLETECGHFAGEEARRGKLTRGRCCGQRGVPREYGVDAEEVKKVSIHRDEGVRDLARAQLHCELGG